MISLIKKFLGGPVIVIAITLSLLGINPNQGAVYAQCADRATDGSSILQQTNLPKTGCGSSTDSLTKIVRFAFAVMTMIALLFVVIGGFKYVISGGDSNAIASAKKTITFAVIGLVLGLSVFLITGYIINQVPTR